MLIKAIIVSVVLVSASSQARAESPVDALEAVRRVHGGAGPWAVAGYRMGLHALRELGLSPYDFQLEVTHASPRAVQYTCIADGAAAATGASLGKLNLSLVEVDVAKVATTFRNKKTGATVTLRPTASFIKRYKDVPYSEHQKASAEILGLADSDIFEPVR